NVLAYAEPMTQFFGRPFDWTKGGVHSISQRTRNYLADQREPVKVYVLMSRNFPITQDVLTLLENFRSLNSKVSWELINPSAPENATRVSGFIEKYSISDPRGLLVMVGAEDSGNFTFIKQTDLFTQEPSMPGRRGSPTYTFTGEAALLNALL